MTAEAVWGLAATLTTKDELQPLVLKWDGTTAHEAPQPALHQVRACFLHSGHIDILQAV